MVGLEAKLSRLALLLLLQELVGSRTNYHVWTVEKVPYTRLCSTKEILTVNGQLPGPTLYAYRGDTIMVEVVNHSDENVTLHWHGAKQPRNPWFDGPEYITQCPIQPGRRFTYKILLSAEEGTIWWHAHIGWQRVTVYGVIIVYPQPPSAYPFPMPYREFIVLLGEWWIKDLNELLQIADQTNRNVESSDAYTINGQPGPLYSCSESGTFRMPVKYGKRYLLRVVNAAMSNGHFFSIASHRLTVVGSDGSYTKPVTTDYILINPGETMDLLLDANQPPTKLYYMAASPYSYIKQGIDNTTTSAVVEYTTSSHLTATPLFPSLPFFNDTEAAAAFTSKLRSLASFSHPINVPRFPRRRIFITVAENMINNGTQFAASLNNVSFVLPSIDMLRAYYSGINGVFDDGFPDEPPVRFDFTASEQPNNLVVPRIGTEVKVLEYGDIVEVVLQGTSLVRPNDHPMHLQGFSFYLVGLGFGNFDEVMHPPGYNLVDPPLKNTVQVPYKGWAAVRFKADNPGVWYMHCHLERHLMWGMSTVFIVKNSDGPKARMLPRPPYMPPC